jgi:hypothetical protein
MPRRLLAAAALILATGSCATPKFQAALAAEMRAAADEIQAQRQEMMLLQEQIDSLRVTIAKQDTVIRKLANLAGMPLPGLTP